MMRDRRGHRGIASGAKIRFARCRLHPRSITDDPDHRLYPPARVGSIRATPSGAGGSAAPLPFGQPPSRGPLLCTLSRLSSLVSSLPAALAPLSSSFATRPPSIPRAPPSLESSNEHRPLILPTATLLDPLPSHPTATHLSVDLTPSPMASRFPPFRLPTPLSTVLLLPKPSSRHLPAVSLFATRVTTFLSFDRPSLSLTPLLHLF